MARMARMTEQSRVECLRLVGSLLFEIREWRWETQVMHELLRSDLLAKELNMCRIMPIQPRRCRRLHKHNRIFVHSPSLLCGGVVLARFVGGWRYKIPWINCIGFLHIRRRAKATIGCGAGKFFAGLNSCKNVGRHFIYVGNQQLSATSCTSIFQLTCLNIWKLCDLIWIWDCGGRSNLSSRKHMLWCLLNRAGPQHRWWLLDRHRNHPFTSSTLLKLPQFSLHANCLMIVLRD